VNNKCLNCGTTLNGEYLQHWWQANTIRRIDFKIIFSTLLSSDFSFEDPFLNTIKQLILTTGFSVGFVALINPSMPWH
jgi:hypothetical protein